MIGSNIKVKCATEGCSVVRGFCFDMDLEASGQLRRKVLAVAGWLVMADSTLFCPDCGEMLQRALDRMSAHQARQIKTALSDALWAKRMEVVGG
jgi:hypothetical protein